MTIGEKIRRTRQQKGITQRQLGEKIGQKGGFLISKYESGTVNPRGATVKRLEEALGISLEESGRQCSRCGNTDNDTDALFCKRCGAPILSPQQELVRDLKALVGFAVPCLPESRRDEARDTLRRAIRYAEEGEL